MDVGNAFIGSSFYAAVTDDASIFIYILNIIKCEVIFVRSSKPVSLTINTTSRQTAHVCEYNVNAAVSSRVVQNVGFPPRRCESNPLKSSIFA